MSKKFIPVLLLFLSLGLLITLKSNGEKERNGDDPKIKHAKILRNVCVLIKDGHFSPKNFDDAFSKQLFKTFLEKLDDDKTILLKSDIQSLKKNELGLDDEIKKALESEINSNTIRSFYEINEVYLKRLNEVMLLYVELLKKPMDFNVKESVQLDAEQSDYPSSTAERTELWRKRLKYAVLGKFVDAQNDREKNAGTVGFVYKADSTLEREARDQVRKQMERYFTTKKNRETIDENFSTYINSITTLMDPHTDYFPPIDTRSFNESMKGSFYGIGAQLKEDDGKIKIASLVPGGPAFKSGELKENDEIIKVGQGNAEPVDVTGYAVADAVKLIRGAAKGSEVRLTVRKIDGNIKVIALIRDDISLDGTFVKSAVIQGANKIGYIYLPEFYADFEKPNGARCAADVAKELAKLKNEKVDGIIIDLRGNGGGSLYDVVQMAGMFIKDGPVCQVKSRSDKPNVLTDRDERIQYDGPLTVMVDGSSASASEIFAAAIQDYKRGIIVGNSSTYGKGTVQRMIPINPEGEFSLDGKSIDDLGNVKLTLQKFYRINGGATQMKGVIPDVIYPDRYDYLKYREKDNPNALPWDEISPAKFQAFLSPEINAAVSQITAEIAADQTFTAITDHVKWLEKQTKKESSLQLDAYKEEQKKMKEVFKTLDELVKTKDSLNFINIKEDLTDINSSTDKIEKNKQWIKVRANDLYINETVKLMNKLIAGRSTANK